MYLYRLRPFFTLLQFPYNITEEYGYHSFAQASISALSMELSSLPSFHFRSG